MSPKSIAILKCNPPHAQKQTLFLNEITCCLQLLNSMFSGKTPFIVATRWPQCWPNASVVHSERGGFWVMLISQLHVVTFRCVEFISCCWIRFRNTHITLHYSAQVEVSQKIYKLVLFVLQSLALCLLVLFVICLGLFTQSSSKASRNPFNKLYNSMSEAGFWEILVRSGEESFLVKKRKHTVSVTRAASFVLACLAIRWMHFTFTGSFCIPRHVSQSSSSSWMYRWKNS